MFAGLSLVVVSAAAATHADAQVRSERRIRRAGKQQPTPPRTDTVTVTRSDTVRIRDTVFVDRPLPAPPPVHDTVRIPPPPPPVRLGYFGVVGGVGLPLSKTKDGTGSNGVGYTVGPSVFGFIGANARSGVLGLRLDGGYTLLRGSNIGNGYSAHSGLDNQATPDLAIYQGTLDGVIRAPFGRDSTGADHGGFYIFGGGGVAHVRSFLQSDQAPDIEQNLTRALIQGGAGLEIGALGAGKIFAEGRFVYIFTPGQKITFVPIGLGVRF
ncbi:hypothetical protein tb265_24270 [Gemmatimonadetes bacterium T265]|nr:hypothetical protein tb265_24270 [Gemmatimonadetes bacterium T265]